MVCLVRFVDDEEDGEGGDDGTQDTQLDDYYVCTLFHLAMLISLCFA